MPTFSTVEEVQRRLAEEARRKADGEVDADLRGHAYSTTQPHHQKVNPANAEHAVDLEEARCLDIRDGIHGARRCHQRPGVC